MRVDDIFPIREPSLRDLASRFWHCEWKRGDDPRWHFSVLLPLSWRPVERRLGAGANVGGLISIARFRDTRPGVRCEAEVYASRVTREISPADWLALRLGLHDVEILRRRRIPSGFAGDRLDVLTRRSVRGQTLLSRWLVLKDGDEEGGRALFIEVRTFVENYEMLAQDLWTIAGSVSFLVKSGWPFCEHLCSFARALPGDFVFLYPESWEISVVRDDQRNDGWLICELVNQVAGEPVGLMTVACSGVGQGREDFLREHLKGIETRGLEPVLGSSSDGGCLAHLGGQSVRGRALLGSTGDMSIRPDGRGDRYLDVLISTATVGGVHFLVGLLAVSRQHVPVLGAVNERAHEVVGQTLRVVPTR